MSRWMLVLSWIAIVVGFVALAMPPDDEEP